MWPTCLYVFALPEIQSTSEAPAHMVGSCCALSSPPWDGGERIPRMMEGVGARRRVVEGGQNRRTLYLHWLLTAGKVKEI